MTYMSNISVSSLIPTHQLLFHVLIPYLTADGPDLSKTGGGPFARRASIESIKIDLKCCTRQNYCSPAKCTFNSSSLALLLLIARAPNMVKLYKFEIFFIIKLK